MEDHTLAHLQDKELVFLNPLLVFFLYFAMLEKSVSVHHDLVLLDSTKDDIKS